MALAQLRCDPVDARLGTGLVIATGRTGYADAADGVLADLDRKSAADADDSGKRRTLRCARILGDLLGELRRRRSEGERRIGFAPAVLYRVRSRAVTADLRQRAAIAADHRHGHVVALGLAGLYRAFRNGFDHVVGEVLVSGQLRIRRNSEGADCGSDGKTKSNAHKFLPENSLWSRIAHLQRRCRAHAIP